MNAARLNGSTAGRPRKPSSFLRIVFAALGALVAVVAVLGGWQVVAARDSQRNQIVGSELAAARLASGAVSSAVTSRLELLENLAGQPGSSALVDPGELPELQLILAELIRLYPQFSSMSVANSSGGAVAEVPPWPATSAVTATRHEVYAQVLRAGRSYVTGAFVQPSGALAVTLGAPVRGSSGAVIAVVQATVPVSTLSAAVGGTKLRGGGTLVIVDQEGHAMTGPARHSLTSARTLPVVSLALAGKSGTATGMVPGFRGSQLVAYAPVRSLRWAVVVQNPLSVLDNPVAALTERLGAIGALVVIFAIATAVALWLLSRRLSRQSDEVEAIFSCVGEGVATLRANGEVVKVNPALEELTGRRAQELEGHSWRDALVLYDEKGEVIDWEQSALVEAIRSRHAVASRGYSLSLLSADGRKLPVAITAAPLFVDSPSPSGAVVVLRDVSREREVDQLKSSLVSTVSHELRTPLTLIQGFSELLLTRTNLDSTQSHAALTQIHASSQRLGRLIDDLLSVSRIESGRLSSDVESIELVDVVSEVVASFSVDQDHRFVMDIEEETGPVLADRDKILQVLTNLVSNAIKYSATGSEVRVSARAVGNHAEIAVTDEGIGMSASDASGIFEKFSRSDRPEVRKVGGTGLGLYITKNLVEIQGGQLWLESEPGLGSTFTFTLRLARRLAAEARHEEDAHANAANRR